MRDGPCVSRAAARAPSVPLCLVLVGSTWHRNILHNDLKSNERQPHSHVAHGAAQSPRATPQLTLPDPVPAYMRSSPSHTTTWHPALVRPGESSYARGRSRHAYCSPGRQRRRDTSRACAEETDATRDGITSARAVARGGLERRAGRRTPTRVALPTSPPLDILRPTRGPQLLDPCAVRALGPSEARRPVPGRTASVDARPSASIPLLLTIKHPLGGRA